MSSELPLSVNNKVLVIHPDEFTTEVLSFNLRRMNYEPVLIEDGRQAFKMLEDRGVPRLVLMDLLLSYRSGYEVLRAYRDDPRWRQVPVLILSRQKSEKTVEQAFREGASDYVKIPFSLRELKARIKRLIGRRP